MELSNEEISNEEISNEEMNENTFELSMGPGPVILPWGLGSPDEE